MHSLKVAETRVTRLTLLALQVEIRFHPVAGDADLPIEVRLRKRAGFNLRMLQFNIMLHS